MGNGATRQGRIPREPGYEGKKEIKVGNGDFCGVRVCVCVCVCAYGYMSSFSASSEEVTSRLIPDDERTPSFKDLVEHLPGKGNIGMHLISGYIKNTSMVPMQ